MVERENQSNSDASDTDIADNHKWADRVAAHRQQGLEKIGLIVIAVVVVIAIVLSLS